MRKGLRSVSQTRPICQLRINLYTCKSNVKQLYLLKSPNSSQAGHVRFLVTRAHSNVYKKIYLSMTLLELQIIIIST